MEGREPGLPPGAPHYRLCFSIVLFFLCLILSFRLYTLIVSHYFQMSSPQGECRRQEVGDLEFLFVLFGGEFAYFAWGGGAVTD